MAKRRVLLVGGDSGVVAVIDQYFRECHGDYEVESIEYCDDALILLRRSPFDLVLILSLNAPWRTWPSLSSPTVRIGSRSAILFLKQMRGLHSAPPAILVSGSAFRQTEEESRANGAFALVLKPVNLPELDRFVRLALEGRDGPTR
jgi:CheY-like chemotaxis protein